MSASRVSRISDKAAPVLSTAAGTSNPAYFTWFFAAAGQALKDAGKGKIFNPDTLKYLMGPLHGALIFKLVAITGITGFVADTYLTAKSSMSRGMKATAIAINFVTTAAIAYGVFVSKKMGWGLEQSCEEFIVALGGMTLGLGLNLYGQLNEHGLNSRHSVLAMAQLGSMVALASVFIPTFAASTALSGSAAAMYTLSASAAALGVSNFLAAVVGACSRKTPPPAAAGSTAVADAINKPLLEKDGTPARDPEAVGVDVDA